MLILIFVIALVISIGCKICDNYTKVDLDVISFVASVVVVVDLVLFIFLVPEVATAGKIDDKITMYEKENTRIETQIAPVIENYMKYEQETFKNLKAEESLVTFATLYPEELKANEMVQQQINLYISNNNKIRELKEEKIDMQTKRWILFFKK